MKFIKNNSYLLLAIVLCVIFTLIGNEKLKNDSIVYENVVVAEGDTLWSYSLKYANDVPTDKWIQEIVKVNNLTSIHIRAGEEIKIPGKKISKVNEMTTQVVGEEK